MPDFPWNFRWVFPVVFYILCFSFNASAQGRSELNISAKETYYEGSLVKLDGQVVIKTSSDAISCDRATINHKTGDIVAEGHVRLESGENYIEGSKITYNYKTKLGRIEKGFVQAGSVIFSGEWIEKLSEKKFVAKSASFSTCATCPALWSFSGTQIEAEMGGYASIKYPILRVLDWPVFILPKIWVPLKSDRQSGLLEPSIENSSRGGTALTLPYFWAISRSQDLTYSLKSYEKRGLKHLAEYRYVLSPGSSGIMQLGYLNDRNYTDIGGSAIDDKEFNRGFMIYQHYYELPNNYVHRASLNFSTDLRYTRDFSDELPGHGDPAHENKISITKNSNLYHLSAEAAYYTNLLKESAEADNQDAVHRMPEIKYSFMEHEILNSNFFFRFDFDYTNFARKDYSYDDVTGTGSSKEASTVRDGTFDYDPLSGKMDLIRTGHRYIFQPSLSYPFHIGKIFDVNPSLTFNQTEYRFNVDPATQPLPNGFNYDRNASRNYLQTDVSVKTKYSAVYYSDKENPKAKKYKHEIEPEVLHSRISHAERPPHIFFGDFENQAYSRRNEALSNEDFFGSSGIQFDNKDRLFDKNIATFSLSNFLIEKYYTGDIANYNRLVTFRLSQSYDFNEAKRENSHAWSSINGLLDLRFKSYETNTTADFYPYAQVTKWSTRQKFILNPKNYLELTYTKDITLDEVQKRTVNKKETFSTGLGLNLRYLDLVGRANFAVLSSQLDSWASRLESWEYVANLKLPGDCWSLKFGHKRELSADTIFKFSLNFDFTGV